MPCLCLLIEVSTSLSFCKLLHVKASNLRFNYDTSSRSEEMIRDCYLTMEPGPWIYYRRSSSEPATSLDSANGFADDEGASERSYEWLTPPGNHWWEYCCLTNFLYYIAILLFVVAFISCIVSIIIDRENNLFASILSYSHWLRSDN